MYQENYKKKTQLEKIRNMGISEMYIVWNLRGSFEKKIRELDGLSNTAYLDDWSINWDEKKEIFLLTVRKYHWFSI